MYYNNIIELLDDAIKHKGFIKVPGYILEHSTYDLDKRKHVGKPMTTYAKKHNVLYAMFYDLNQIINTINEKPNTPNSKFFLNNCFFIKDDEHYVNIYNLLQLTNQKPEQLIELKNYFEKLKNIILKINSNKLYLQFYKANHPVRLELDVLDHSEGKLFQEEVDSIYNMEQPESFKDILKGVMKASFFRRNRYCWITIDDSFLMKGLMEWERREIDDQ